MVCQFPMSQLKNWKQETFEFFRKRAFKNQRIKEESLADSNDHLIENLQLKEGVYLKRAAIMLFHPDPEMFVTGAYVKIGYFQSDDDLKFQDEIHGNLFEQIDNVMDLLFTKYIKAEISYENISRVEKFEYPKEAVREALLNAVAHKDYSGGIPIQISVYQDKIIFGMKDNYLKTGQCIIFWKSMLPDLTILILQILYSAVDILKPGDVEPLKLLKNVERLDYLTLFSLIDQAIFPLSLEKIFFTTNTCSHLT